MTSKYATEALEILCNIHGCRIHTGNSTYWIWCHFSAFYVRSAVGSI